VTSILSYLSKSSLHGSLFNRLDFLNRSRVCLIIGMLVIGLSSNNAFSAQSYSELQIIQPQAGKDTTNRFYKAYPGLLYEVRVAAIGGAFPFKYALTAAPDGMKINASNGIVSWQSPTASSTPYAATVSVTDSNGVVKSVNWTITVTTDKFLFVDPVNGNDSAKGTIDDPIKSFYGVYGGNDYASKYATKNQGKFVYFKTGDYVPDGYRGSSQMVQLTTRQPLVWLAYPGHKPVIKMSKLSFEAKDNPQDNMYVEGFEIDTINTDAATEQRMGFRISGSSSNVTFRKNYFHGMTYTEGSYNQSAIMISNGGGGKNWSFQENEFSDIHKGYGILGYAAENVLVEDNYFHEMDSGHPIGPKTNTKHWSIRKNKIINCKDYGIWLYGNESNFSYMEVSYNYVALTSGLALSVNEAYNSSLNNIYVFRNTFVGGVRFSNINPTNLTFALSNNVIVNSTSSGVVCEECKSTLLTFSSGNVVGVPLTGIVDVNGILTSGYKASLGKVGWEFLDEHTNPPRAPQGKLIY